MSSRPILAHVSRFASSGAPLLLLAALAVPVIASDRVSARVPEDADQWCDESRSWNDSRHHSCEVREYTLAAPRGTLSVDGGTNGGIKVTAWDRKDVRVQAKVEVWADTEDEATDVAAKIKVSTSGARVEASGPDDQGDSWRNGKRKRIGWGVSYRVYVPRHTDLDLVTHNGGIAIDGVSGKIGMEALNGGIALANAGGDVTGRTTNGGIAVELDGSRWNGAGLDLVTTNGAVAIEIPEDYSARLETGTTNGRVHADQSIELRGEDGERYTVSRKRWRPGRLHAELGRNGAPIRVMTTNGAVRVARAD